MVNNRRREAGENMQKIVPNLWFDSQAEEASNFYVSLFNNNPAFKKESKVGEISRYDEASAKVAQRPLGSVMVVEFQLEGQDFIAINGGPIFEFTEAVSFLVNCETQEEVDYFWEKLTSDGGQEGVCGWLKDKYGLSWQISPVILDKMLKDEDKEKARRVTEAMLKMKKIEIEGLKKAYNEE